MFEDFYTQHRHRMIDKYRPAISGPYNAKAPNKVGREIVVALLSGALAFFLITRYGVDIVAFFITYF